MLSHSTNSYQLNRCRSHEPRSTHRRIDSDRLASARDPLACLASNGPPVMSLVNGTVFYPLQREGDWLLVAPACDLTPTWAWSWNAGVPLNRCWVYF